MTIHDFNDSLAYSHDQANQPWWEQVYRKAFPDMTSMVDLRHDGWHQRAGRDRAVILTNGRAVYIDEKARSEAYDDVAIEVWSVYPKSGTIPYQPIPGAKNGWAREPKDCDWLAYAFVPTRTCHLFPFLGIRAAWTKHGRVWIDNATAKTSGFCWTVAKNPRYNSISIAVPTWLLQDAISDAMTITWESA